MSWDMLKLLKLGFAASCFLLNNKTNMFSLLWENNFSVFFLCSFFLFLCYFSFSFMQEGFLNSDIVVCVWWPTNIPIFLRILSLLTHFTGLTTLQSLVSAEALQWALTKLGLVFEGRQPKFFVVVVFPQTQTLKELCQSWHCRWVWWPHI